MKNDLILDQTQPLTITVEEAARRAGISVGTAYKLVHRDIIPHLNAGRRTLIPTAKFLRWLQQSDETERPAPDDVNAPRESALTCEALAKPGKMPAETAHTHPPARTEIVPTVGKQAHIEPLGMSGIELLSDNRESITGKCPYAETNHRQKMRELARALADEISLPSLLNASWLQDLPLEFTPGEYSLQVGVLEIDGAGHLKVKCRGIGDGLAEPHLVKGLYTHLSSGGPSFATLAGHQGKLERWVTGISEYYSAALGFLRNVKEMVGGYDTLINYHDEAIPGLTRWFLLTLWGDAIQKGSGYFWIDDNWYKKTERISTFGLWQLRCGSYVIGIATSEDKLAIYQTLHKNIRQSFASDESANIIASKSKELEGISRDIGQCLRKFADMEHLPGFCELC